MEVDCPISKSDFTSGRVFGRGSFEFPCDEATKKPAYASATALKKKFAVPLKAASVNTALLKPQRSNDDDFQCVPRKGLDLEPVNLMQRMGSEKAVSSAHTSCWSAHW